MRGFGITSPIPRHISIALGTPDLTPLEVAAGLRRASRTAAAASRRGSSISSPTPAAHVVEDLRNTPPGPQVISPEVDYVIVNMMKGVVAARHREATRSTLGRPPPARPARARTISDVWFNGFTTDLLAVGVDRPRRLDADRRQDHRRRRGGADLARLHAEGAPAHEGARLPGAAANSRSRASSRGAAIPAGVGAEARVDAVRARHAARPVPRRPAGPLVRRPGPAARRPAPRNEVRRRCL